MEATEAETREARGQGRWYKVWTACLLSRTYQWIWNIYGHSDHLDHLCETYLAHIKAVPFDFENFGESPPSAFLVWEDLLVLSQ